MLHSSYCRSTYTLLLYSFVLGLYYLSDFVASFYKVMYFVQHALERTGCILRQTKHLIQSGYVSKKYNFYTYAQNTVACQWLVAVQFYYFPCILVSLQYAILTYIHDVIYMKNTLDDASCCTLCSNYPFIK